MDFRELRYVVAVADCSSITQAARQLFISQPSLSYALGQIEKEMGVKLFDRSRQPLVLTEAGRLYVKTARHILQEERELKNRLTDLKDGQGAQIRLGIPSERAGYMLPPVINKFRAKYPDSEFSIQEAGSEELLELLENNRVDFVICPWDKDDREISPDFTSELIYIESIVLVAAKNAFRDDMFLDKKARLVDLAKIIQLPFIGIKKRHSIHEKAEEIFRRSGLIPHLLLSVESSSSAAQLAACGLGYTLIPRRAKKILGPAAEEYCYHYSRSPVQWKINAFYRKDGYLNKAERYFLELLKQEFGQGEKE